MAADDTAGAVNYTAALTAAAQGGEEGAQSVINADGEAWGVEGRWTGHTFKEALCPSWTMQSAMQAIQACLLC